MIIEDERKLSEERVAPLLFKGGRAVNTKDILDRRILVGNTYLAHHYIEPDNANLLPDSEYNDRYEPHSIPFVIKKDDAVVGSMRLVDGTKTVLPIIYDGLTVFPEFEEFRHNIRFEFSQLARAKSARHWGVVPSIVRATFDYLREVGEKEAIGSIDDLALATLNGGRYHFGVQPIGPSQFYLGSNTTPIRFEIDEVIESVTRAGNTAMAHFLSGKNAPGFEWYNTL